MKKLSLVLILIVVMLASCNKSQKRDIKVVYPETATVDHVDTYFGVEVADPYRWLENDTSAETEKWVIEQNKVTQDYISQIPFRDKIKNRLEKIWNYPKLGTPFKKANWVFYFKNEGLQNQAVLYVKEGMDGEARVLIDPNKLSEDGTVALGGISISKDGKYLAYRLNKAGSDWSNIKVMEVATGEDLPDNIEWVKFSGASWKDDGFFYSRYPEPEEGKEYSNVNEHHKIYYHKIGDTQDKDILIYENPSKPQRTYYAGTTDDERFLIISETESTTGNALYFKDLNNKNSKITQIVKGFEKDYSVIDNIDDKLIIITNQDAPKYKVVLVDTKTPTSNWVDFIPEKNEVLQGIKFAGDKLFAMYMKDATSVVEILDTDANFLSFLELPTLGSIGSFSGEKDDNTLFYSFTSFTFPSVIYSYDIENNVSTEYFRPDIDVDLTNYETKQVFYTSKDGTKVPMFIVHKKDIKLDGNNPVMLYGYGGFNISLTPGFSISRTIFLENGGVYAMPNIRGGGEYGEEWHMAGTVLNKQNVFDDFISAAEYLIEQNYTNPNKIAISGGSNGGLLVGACMTQRPDLFKVALPAVGVLDMLRYHKFTIGWAWATDYGTSDDETQFHYLLKYSPLHNINDSTCYPATLITTGDHDDRVVPAHSFKFAATLQANQSCDNPVLIRIETNAGHGGGKPTSKVIDEVADTYAFMFYNLGMDVVVE